VRLRLYRWWSLRATRRVLADDRATSISAHACYHLGQHHDDKTIRRCRLIMRLRRRILNRIELREMMKKGT
jgi:hypothetical protein